MRADLGFEHLPPVYHLLLTVIPSYSPLLRSRQQPLHNPFFLRLYCVFVQRSTTGGSWFLGLVTLCYYTATTISSSHI